jgi:hypothetical protein
MAKPFMPAALSVVHEPVVAAALSAAEASPTGPLVAVLEKPMVCSAVARARPDEAEFIRSFLKQPKV